MQSQERGAFSKRMGWLGQAQYDSEGGVVRLRPDTKSGGGGGGEHMRAILQKYHATYVIRPWPSVL